MYTAGCQVGAVAAGNGWFTEGLAMTAGRHAFASWLTPRRPVTRTASSAMATAGLFAFIITARIRVILPVIPSIKSTGFTGNSKQTRIPVKVPANCPNCSFCAVAPTGEGPGAMLRFLGSISAEPIVPVKQKN
jgi:hypothetical protein